MAMKYTTIYILFQSDNGEEFFRLPLVNEISTSLRKNDDMFKTQKSVTSFADTIGTCFLCWDLTEDDVDDMSETVGNFIKQYSDGTGDSGYAELKKIVGKDRQPKNFDKIILFIDREINGSGGHEFSWNIYDLQRKAFSEGGKKGGKPGAENQSCEQFMRSLLGDSEKEESKSETAQAVRRNKNSEKLLPEDGAKEYKKLNDIISVNKADENEFLINNEWSFILPAGLEYNVDSEFTGGIEGGIDLSGSEKPMVIKGLRQEGKYLFNFALEKHVDFFGNYYSVLDCRYDNRFASEESGASRVIAIDGDDLYVDIIAEGHWLFGTDTRIRIRGDGISPFNFYSMINGIDQEDFSKITDILKKIAASVSLKSRPGITAKKKPASQNTSKAPVSDPNCIIDGKVLKKYIGKNMDVVLPQGISEIENNVFSGSGIVSVMVPEGVKTIGRRVFENCFNLGNAVLPNSLKKLGGYSFVDCHNLRSVTLGKNLESISDSLFSECYELENVLIPKKVQYIDAFAFKNCRAFTHIVIPDGVTSIGISAFNYCENLEYLYIPASVTDIVDKNIIGSFMGTPFEGCDKLTVHCPKGSAAEEYCKQHGIAYEIDDTPKETPKANAGSRSAERGKKDSADITEEGTTSILDAALDYMKAESLKEDRRKWLEKYGQYVEPTSYLLFNGFTFVFSGIKMQYFAETEAPVVKAVIERGGIYRKSVSGITDYLVVDPRFAGESKIKAVIEQNKKGKDIKVILIEDIEEILGLDASERQSEDSENEWHSRPDYSTDVENWSAVDQNGNSDIVDNADSDVFFAIEDNKLSGVIPYSHRDIIIPDGVQTIGFYSFRGKNTIESVTIPSSVRKIEGNAFQDCSSLSRINILEGVEYIGERAFSGCTELKQLILPNSVKWIMENAFSGCTKLENLTLGSGTLCLGNSMMNGCSSLLSITIPQRVKIVPESAFEGCKKLSSVTIPGGVRRIERSAFEGCSALTELSIPSSVESISPLAFKDCTALRRVEIKNGNAAVSDSAFNDSVWVNLSAPEGSPLMRRISEIKPNTEIGPEEHKNDATLTSFQIPEGIETIGHNAFHGCRNLAEVAVPDSMKAISHNAFADCKRLAHIDFPEGIEVIGAGAFRNCSHLEGIRLPGSLLDVSQNSFAGCKGSPLHEEDDAIYLEAGGNPRFVFMKLKDPEAESCVIHPDTCVIAGFAFENTAIQRVILPEGLRALSSHAFSEAKALAEIEIPESVTRIGYGCFNKCESLRKVALPSDLQELPGALFNECKNLSEVNIPASVTSVGDSCFNGCRSMREIRLPQTVSKIGNYAFQGCNKLTSFDLPEKLTCLSRYLFKNCTKLASVHIPDNVTRIESEAFYGCKSLRSFVGPKDLKTVSYDFLDRCESILTATLPENTVITEAYSEKPAVNKFPKHQDGTPIRLETPSGRPIIQEPSDTVIEEGALKHYYGNESHVILPAGIREINYKAFDNNDKVEEITIPASVETINSFAISKCSNLRRIIIENGTIRIDSYAIDSCYHLESVVIPDSVAEFGHGFLSDCPNAEIIAESGSAAEKIAELLEIKCSVQTVKGSYREKYNAAGSAAENPQTEKTQADSKQTYQDSPANESVNQIETAVSPAKADPGTVYATLYEAEPLAIQKGYPVILEKIRVVKDLHKHQALSQAVFRSLTGERIRSVELFVECFDEDGVKLQSLRQFTLPVSIMRKNSFFGQTEYIPLPDERTCRVEVTIKKMEMGDWRVIAEWPEKTALPRCEEAESYFHDQTLADAYKEERKGKNTKIPVRAGGYWRCACGEINPDREEVCSKCGENQKEIFAQIDPAYLKEKLKEKETEREEDSKGAAYGIIPEKEAKQAAEPAAIPSAVSAAEVPISAKETKEPVSRHASEEERDAASVSSEKTVERKGKKRIVILLIAFLLAAAVIVAALFLLRPVFNYQRAQKALDNGAYDTAYALFSGLNYKDSQEKSREAAYLLASELMNGGDFGQAEEMFGKASGYRREL